MKNSTAAPCTPTNFFLDLPLYEEIAFADHEDAQAYEIAFFEGPMDAYCPACDAHSIFHRTCSKPIVHEEWVSYGSFLAVFRCSRNRDHELKFWLHTDWEYRTLQKIGQLPSLATLSAYDVKKYGGVLEKETFRELTKAIGLASHGVGVGSFVYLRRIFEGLVEEAHSLAKLGESWDEGTFQKCRMADRIQQLRAHLPVFLVENRLMYSILSKGIHELSEKECLAAFPIVKVGIEIILDAKLQADAERRKLEAAKRAIQALAGTGVSSGCNLIQAAIEN